MLMNPWGGSGEAYIYFLHSVILLSLSYCNKVGPQTGKPSLRSSLVASGPRTHAVCDRHIFKEYIPEQKDFLTFTLTDIWIIWQTQTHWSHLCDYHAPTVHTSWIWIIFQWRGHFYCNTDMRPMTTYQNSYVAHPQKLLPTLDPMCVNETRSISKYKNEMYL